MTTSTAASQEAEEQRVVLHDVPWNIYVALRDSVESPAIRMTYLDGFLEIISPSKRHEDTKSMIGRLLELFAWERDIDLYAHGSVTLREELIRRGLEPDECYCRGEDKAVLDLAIEVVITAPRVDKLEVYRGLGVREVWTLRDGGITVHVFGSDQYERNSTSRLFPEVDLSRLARFATRTDQPAALREFAELIRGH